MLIFSILNHSCSLSLWFILFSKTLWCFPILRSCYTTQFFLQLATQRWRIKNLSSCKGGVTRLLLFSQIATRTITNKMADAKDELRLAHSEKIALQVAEGMLHASNLSRNVAKIRGSFYFSCNSQRNNCSCKIGFYTGIFFATCNATFVALQVAKKLPRVTWPLI